MRFFLILTLFFLNFFAAFAAENENLPDNFVPAMWLDESTLLAVVDYEIVKYDVEKKLIKEVLYKADKNLIRLDPFNSCFSLKRWILRAKEVNGVIATLDLDPANLEVGTLKKNYGNINHLDCTPEYEARKNSTLPSPSEISFHNKSYNLFHFEPRSQLVMAADGESFIYGNSESFLISAKNTDAVEKKIILSDNNHQNLGNFNVVNSAFDHVNNLYLWYANTSRFKKSLNIWPMKAWWISRDLDVISELVLPQGPWIVDKLDETKCGDCGCECNSKMKIYINAGKIFIKISGNAVDEKTRGLYQLETTTSSTNTKWKQLITDNIKSEITISKNNCLAAYVDDNDQGKIVNLCK